MLEFRRYNTRKKFDLGKKIDRISFLLELYNLSSNLQKEGESEDTRRTRREREAAKTADVHVHQQCQGPL